MTATLASLFILAASGGGNPLASQFLPIILMIVMFYLLLIRPQQKQRKELQARIDSMEKGDKVITTGGLHGTVHQISEKTVTLKPGGDNVFLTFDKPSVASVIKLKSEKAESAKDEKSDKSEKKK
ncbi:MAG: preprotein translocase subunit YajC [Roseibacillus sp.]